MIVVTGAAGFIGSCIVAKLNELGHERLILVDHYDGDTDPKRLNLRSKRYVHLLDKEEFLKLLVEDRFRFKVETFIHMGACSSTTLQDEDYFQKNNFEYSCHAAKWAMAHGARFIYASSAATYGGGERGYRDDAASVRECRPLNLYGQSKQKFDEWVLDQGLLDRLVGLKFFNVFGPNEYHKDDMRSVIAKAYEGVIREGRIRLFKSYKPGIADGEQKRDFIYVKDAVDIIMFFVNRPDVNGIFNVGTGQARSWNELAEALFAAAGKEPHIEYFDMPETLRDKYQYFTQADMGRLREAGYQHSFTPLEDAVKDYVAYLKDRRYW